MIGNQITGTIRISLSFQFLISVQLDSSLVSQNSNSNLQIVVLWFDNSNSSQ
jgi:hypothetical protein